MTETHVMGEAIAYFATIWIVAALAGVSRCVHNGNYRSLGHTCSVAGVSGFLGLGVVAMLCGDYFRDDFDTVYYLGVSSVIGLAGKEQTELITIIWRSPIARLKGKP